MSHVDMQDQLSLLLQELPQERSYPQLAADAEQALQQAPQASAALLRHFLQALLATVDPQRAMIHLLRYLDATPTPAKLWETWQQRPDTIACVLTIFAASQFLSSILWRRPSLLFWLVDGALWAEPPTPEALAAELGQMLRDDMDEADVTACLRTFTQRHLLRIGARDLNQVTDVETTTADLSALADNVVQAGLTACQQWLVARHGAPWYIDETGTERPCHFCVIGMGKLGGYELNFASDIDVMYVYTSYEGHTRGVLCDGVWQQQISNHEYFVALARRVTNVIGGKGPEGQAFRVDLRLRPDGTQGQLALSLLSYEAYYARFGQTWERMALIKARPIAGDRELGEEFMALVRPFSYQRHLDPSGLRHLHDNKLQLDGQIAQKDQTRTNVKLGKGGIREIEFYIQILQLVFGGQHSALQERHSLRALTLLRHYGFISAEIETTLRQAYCYLRAVEHYVQMEQGAQTHTLPHNEAQRLRLARQFGYQTWESFYHDYLERTEAVHTLCMTAFDGV
jgi:glutamate-ammonia-ligase adenylyltransferase